VISFAPIGMFFMRLTPKALSALGVDT
jgi:hypothetical protein